ncbi:hypothetical protein [Streptomyces calvus]|jgi:hypothetical protein|uniref:Uncharacterized protein n=1 Tax=Streptomyces calvus TaxID=67282 RepID=A0A514JJ78_9ACTN|nr:hypothetical protein [Streptomyces calvus]QDI67370.1 hypothetical protein CD934_00765 [Streptomyces calvus]
MTDPSIGTPASRPAATCGPLPRVRGRYGEEVLHVYCAPDPGCAVEHHDLVVPSEIDGDAGGRVTDVVVKDLPAGVLAKLGRHTRAPVEEASPAAGISLDPDAGRLWLHLGAGRRVRRRQVRARVRLTFGDGVLTAVELVVPAGAADGGAQDRSR